MPSTDCPCLRGFLAAVQDESDSRYVILWDKLGLGASPLRVTLPEFLWLEMFDGERTLRDIQADAFGRADASPCAINGSSDYGDQRYTLPRKHFRTPLGAVPTDHAYIDCVVAR